MGTENLAQLQKLGFKNIHLQAWLASEASLAPVRISAVDRGLCRAISVHSGLQSSSRNPADLAFEVVRLLPHRDQNVAVGDWVLSDLGAEHARILHILPRTSFLSRQASGGRSSEQAIASNVDIVFIVAAAAPTRKLTRRGINPRRLERYILAARQAGASPIIIINKCDLAAPEDIDHALGERAGDVEVIRTSALSKDPYQELAERLDPSSTAALVGPSGVGKSTITNTLIGAQAEAIGSVRSADTKGRHTTTRRSLHTLPGGSFLIDTPGMREFGIVSAEGVLDDSGECRFSDCTHSGEPGCAIREAIEAGELSAEWVKDQAALKEEALRHEARHDAYSRHLLHKKEKRLAGIYRTAQTKKRR